MRRDLHTHRRRVAAALALGSLTLLGAACSDDDAVTALAPSTAAPSTTAHDHEVVGVTAVDFGFDGLPERVAAGTRLTLSNDAPTELHELVAIRLPDEEQRSVDELLALPPEQLGALLESAPPATVLLAAPGSDQVTAVGDGTLSEPGRYLVMCAIPTGADPAEYLAAAAESQGGPPQVDGGPPHFVHGMAAELVVE